MTLDLDARQRAMLAEMGVRVWWPEHETQVAPITAPITAPTTAPKAPELVALRTVEVPAQTAPAVDVQLGQRPDGIDRMDWTQLQSTVASCQACGLCRTRKQTVFGVGPAPSVGQVDWLIVGEAPGEHEDEQGEPFVGQAGKLLDNMLKASGLSRQAMGDATRGSVYITNVLKCRPPGNRNPHPDEVAQCAPYLQRQIALLNPKIMVAMGRFAVQALLADSVTDVHNQPLGKLRGQVYRYQGVPVVVTYHPAYLLRSLSEKSKAWSDWCLAMAQLNPA